MTAMEFETIIVERPEPRIARIVMNRPEARNAQNLQMTYDLNAAFDAAVQDDAVKVIILAGNGPHFSAGHDLRAGGQERRRRGFSAGRKLGRLRRAERPRPLRARAGDLSADHAALAQSGQADDRRSARQVHRRRADAGLGLRPDRRQPMTREFCDPVVTMGVCGVEWFVHPWELGPRKAKELLFTADAWSARGSAPARHGQSRRAAAPNCRHS